MKNSGLSVAACIALKPSQNVCFKTVFSGDVAITPTIVPMEPTKLTPRKTHGLVAMMRKATPERKSDRAARAVSASPPPVYLKASLRYERSAGLNASRVSRLRKPLTTTTVPAMVPCTVNLQHDRSEAHRQPAKRTKVIA